MFVNFRSNRIESQSEEVEGASAINIKADKEKEEKNEAGSATSSQEQENSSLLDSSQESTADGPRGAVVEEGERNREEGGVEVVENATRLADTVNTLQNTTGAEPTVVLRC